MAAGRTGMASDMSRIHVLLCSTVLLWLVDLNNISVSPIFCSDYYSVEECKHMLEHMQMCEYLVIEPEVPFSNVDFVVKDTIQTYYTHHGLVP